MPETFETRLCLVAPPAQTDTDCQSKIENAVNGGDIAAIRLFPDTPGLQTLVPFIQSRDVAVMMKDDVALARELGCDGVHLTDPAAHIGKTREALGIDAYIGVFCRTGRHDAMVAAERGADYVSFRAGAEAPGLLRWWQEMMEIPCMVEGAITIEDAAEYAESGADFVTVFDAIWDDPDGPGKAVEKFTALF